MGKTVGIWKAFAIAWLIPVCLSIHFSAMAQPASSRTGQPVQIIPQPVSIVQREGVFRIGSGTRIYVFSEDREVMGAARRFAAEWKTRYGATLAISSGAASGGGSRAAIDTPGNSIVISLRPRVEIKNGEGYIIEIGSRRVDIIAPAPAGIFYALESLQQLGPRVNCGRILDYPRYPYRGMHLDVSRHFFGVAFIKQYLDILASFKINTFHWHLTDSHGWRIEIKRYPRLTSVGAWRADRTGIPMTIAAATAPGEPATYGGYYTQDEIREIVAYAKDRFIAIIPEIEMPGHCTAALVAYPEYADLDNKIPLLMPCGYPGDLLHNFCVGYDSTFVFLQNILEEVMQLFPSPFIHIGGDEVRPGPWLNCPRCRQRMKDNGLTTGQQLQAWFTRRIDSFITVRGRRMIGWDEIMQAEISPGAAVMSWHGNAGGIAAAKKGHDVVMAPYQYTYFDFYQSDPGLEPDITYAPLFLDSVYAFDPSPPELTGQMGYTPGDASPGSAAPGSMADHILGSEACLWTENVPSPARVEYMLLPRLLALSEVLWSPPEKKDYARFITKVERQFSRFDAEGINYATSIYNVAIRPVFDSAGKDISVGLSDQANKYTIRYTLDGSAVSAVSPVYHAPLTIAGNRSLQTALFKNGKRMGKISRDRFALHKALGASIWVSPMPDSASAGSFSRLVDGIFGTVEPFDGRWVSFHDSLLTLTIDLQRRRDIHSVNMHFMEDQVGNIYLPRSMELAFSEDGTSFRTVYRVENRAVPQQLLRHVVGYEKKEIDRTARYLRLTIRNANLSTDPVKNGIFMDEIVVE
jgi:hexosaminidase